MAKKGGLGRGLDSLISMNANVGMQQNDLKSIHTEKQKPQESKLPLRQIEPNKNQPRKQFDEESIAELAESIKQYGIIQPIVVQQREEKSYEIVVGERRWRAAKLAGLKEVPAIIKNYTEQELAEIALVENLQREDLNPIEEALAYRRLIQEFHLKQEEVAQKVAKSRSVVTNSLRLLKLSDAIQQMLVDEKLSIGHAKVLLGIEEMEVQDKAAEYVVQNQLSVRQTEDYVKSLLNPKEKKQKPVLEHEDLYRSIEEKMKQKTGTKVKIVRKAENKGKIEIEYYSVEDLERIMEFLS